MRYIRYDPEICVPNEFLVKGLAICFMFLFHASRKDEIISKQLRLFNYCIYIVSCASYNASSKYSVSIYVSVI